MSHSWATKILRERKFHHILRLMGATRDLDERLADQARQSILTAEGSEHQRLRRLVSPAFTPKQADKLRPFMASTINSLIDAVAADSDVNGRRHCEVVAEICEPYPIPIICELLGAPVADLDKFSTWATGVISGLDRDANDKIDNILACREALEEYVVELIARRRSEPRDDLLTVLIQAEEQGDRLSEVELVTMVEAVLVAGVDTTRNQLGCAVALLAERPEVWKQLAEDPDIAPTVVDEVMRYIGAIRGTGRYASEDVVIDDIAFPQGTIIMVSFVAGNYDSEAFASPGTFDIEQHATDSQHLSFGSGIHFCLGSFLAKAELQVALPILARRMPNMALAKPVEWKSAQVTVWGPERLEVTFDTTTG
ncbi:MAG: cytochrome P450 [Actinobacteria bacterium]|nr:cytochrome P450 [Actinomycetota bacterium]